MRAAYLATLSVLFAGNLAAQELKKEYLDPVEDTASSTIVKVKGGSLLFLAGHTASVPDRNARHVSDRIERTGGQDADLQADVARTRPLGRRGRLGESLHD